MVCHRFELVQGCQMWALHGPPRAMADVGARQSIETMVGACRAVGAARGHRSAVGRAVGIRLGGSKTRSVVAVSTGAFREGPGGVYAQRRGARESREAQPRRTCTGGVRTGPFAETTGAVPSMAMGPGHSAGGHMCAESAGAHCGALSDHAHSVKRERRVSGERGECVRDIHVSFSLGTRGRRRHRAQIAVW